MPKETLLYKCFILDVMTHSMKKMQFHSHQSCSIKKYNAPRAPAAHKLEVLRLLDLFLSAHHPTAYNSCVFYMLGVASMQPATERSSTKRLENLSINKYLLLEARSLNINLSATLEQALTEKIRQEKRRQWVRRQPRSH